MNPYLTKIKIIFIGIKQQRKAIIQSNLGKKLALKMLRKFGMGIKKKRNLKQNILVLEIWK